MTVSNDLDTRDLLKKAYLEIRTLRSRIAERDDARNEPIAIVGLGCRFPAGAVDAESFWNVLHDGVDAVGLVPRERWDTDALFDPDPDAPGKLYTRHGAFVDGVDQFDAALFGISPVEAGAMDPQQRLLLEVAWEALENAGIAADALRETRTGVFIGLMYQDYLARQLRETGRDGIGPYLGVGSTFSAAAGRLSYVLGLQGPSIAVDTACSSSLVSVHLACQALRNRECDVALAGGANVMLTPEASINLSKARMLSPSGRCRTFDAAADGYIRGEGCGLIVVKRLSDARADGDRILGLVRGSAVNQDGRSSGLTAPNGSAQRVLLREALAAAGATADDVEYIECHGTGTPLGDPIEVGALLDVYGERSPDKPLAIGSVKTNFGHLESAAGICGLIKSLLILRHREIPPHLHLTKLNPHIRMDGKPVVIPTAPTPWFRGETRLAAISAFGFVGTNAHVILEAFDEAPSAATPRDAHVLTLSAASEPALHALRDRYVAYLQTTTDDLGDICYTANTGRSHMAYRIAAVARNRAEMAAKLREAQVHRIPDETPEVAPLETQTPDALVALYLRGARVDWSAFPGHKVALPTYAFQRERYWIKPARKPFLTRLPQTASEPETFAWDVDTSRTFLHEHRLLGTEVWPIAAQIAVALDAARELFGVDDCEIRDLEFRETLYASAVHVQVVLRAPAGAKRSERQAKRSERRLSAGRAAGFQPAGEAELFVYSRPSEDEPWSLSTTAHVGPAESRRPGRLKAGAPSASLKTGASLEAGAPFDASLETGASLKAGARKTGASRNPDKAFPALSMMFFAAKEEDDDRYRLIVEAARFADRNGFRGVWVPERHFTHMGSLYPSPSVLHAALARETRRVRLMAGSVVVPLHHVARIAEEWAMVDNLSGGRVGISLASGWNPDDFVLAPEKYEDRYRELYDGIDLLRRLWRGESFEGDAPNGRTVTLRTYPTPVQRELPLWITAARSPESFQRAGALGANLLTHLLDQDVETLAGKIALYRAARAEHGFDPDAGIVSVMCHTFVAPDLETAHRLAKQPFCDYLKASMPLLAGLATSRGKEIDVHKLSGVELDEFVEFLYERFSTTRALIGTPETARTLIDALHTAGVDEIACLLDFGPSTDQVLDHLPLLATLQQQPQQQPEQPELITPANRQPPTANPVEITDHLPPATPQHQTQQQPDFVTPANRQPPTANPVESTDLPTFYASLSAAGIDFDGSLRGLTSLALGDREALAEVAASSEESIVLDACIQSALAALPRQSGAPIRVPTSVRRIRVHRRATGKLLAHGRVEAAHADGGIEGDVTAFDEHGDVVIEIEGLHVRSLATPARLAKPAHVADHWFYEIAWRELPWRDTKDASRPWIILEDTAGVGRAFASRRFGAPHVFVQPGPITEQIGPAQWTVDPERGFPRLLRQLDLSAYEGILSLWPLHTSPHIEDAQRLGIEAMTTLVQALAQLDDATATSNATHTSNAPHTPNTPHASNTPHAANTPHASNATHTSNATHASNTTHAANATHASNTTLATNESNAPHAPNATPASAARRSAGALAGWTGGAPAAVIPPLWLVTRNAQATRNEPVDVAQAPLWGFAGALAREHPECWGGIIDLDADTGAATLDRALRCGDGEDQLAIRDDRRFARRLVRAAAPTHTASFRDDASYLIAGGAGGLGLEVARWMIGRGARHLLLAGRSKTVDLPPLGASVTYVALDIADEAQLAAFLASYAGPPLRGVVHAAGVFRDESLLHLDRDRLWDVLRSKVSGASSLHRATRTSDLDFFVMFSSFSAITPPHGQAAYAAASAFLDALAHARRAEGLPAVSINWGAWSDVGFAATEYGAEAHRRLEAIGMKRMTPREGLAALERLFAPGVPPQMAVFPMDVRGMTALDPAIAHAPLLRELARIETPREESHGASLDALRAMDAPAQREFLEKQVARIVAAIMEIPAARLETRTPLTQLGLDSLVAVQLKNRVQKEVGLTMPLVNALRGGSVVSLVDDLLVDLRLGSMRGDVVEVGAQQELEL